MPKIELKPNSPEYRDLDDHTQTQRCCDVAGCLKAGEYRAPKARGSSEYYYFCLEHVRDYNSAWDFFDGMTPAQAHEEMLRSLYGDRPTWKYTGAGNAADNLRRSAWQSYNFTDENPDESGFDEGADEEYRRRQTAFTYHKNAPEYQAMATLELEPPLDLERIKKRYKELAKKHHPDLNEDKDAAQERLKEINHAYTLLKSAFEKYEKIVNED